MKWCGGLYQNPAVQYLYPSQGSKIRSLMSAWAGLHSKFEASLSYMRPCPRTKQKNINISEVAYTSTKKVESGGSRIRDFGATSDPVSKNNMSIGTVYSPST